MKKWIVPLLICFVFFQVKIIYAGDLPEPQKPYYELGAEIFHISYVEPGLMKQGGILYGVTFSASYTDKYNILLKVDARGAKGEVDYSSPYSGYLDNIKNQLFELRGLVGYRHLISKSEYFEIYTGLGSRNLNLNDNSAGQITSEGHYGYERDSSYIYSPIGIAIATIEKDNWTQDKWLIKVILEYDIFWIGKQKTYLSDVDPGYNDIENRQKNGYGLRGSVKFSQRGKKINFSAEPFINYWRIKDSDEAVITYFLEPIGYGWEPENYTVECGIKITAEF